MKFYKREISEDEIKNTKFYTLEQFKESIK